MMTALRSGGALRTDRVRRALLRGERIPVPAQPSGLMAGDDTIVTGRPLTAVMRVSRCDLTRSYHRYHAMAHSPRT
jgi:hypothetical protein